VSKERSISYPIGGLLSSAQQMWITGKGLTGTNPALSGVPGGTAGAAAPQQPSSPMDVLSKIGSVLTDATSSIMMGKVYEPNLQPQETASTAPISGSGSFGGKMGTLPLPAGVTKWKNVFDSTGAKYGIEPAVMEAVAAQESGGNANLKGAAWGLMQIENGGTTDEFIKFGRDNGQAYTSSDRLDPTKAIPFATYRMSKNLKRYKGDYLKTLQAYNFSEYSLDALIKHTGDDWMNRRKDVGKFNGTGLANYGDPQYIEHVLRYYHGNVIKQAGGNGLDDLNIGGQKMNPIITTTIEKPEVKKPKKKWYKGQELKGFGEEGGNGGDDATPRPKDSTSSVKVNKFINNS
ncbi:transglycosylase SLT domain-containing protein, partial [Arthrospira platensis SPKY2]